MSFVISAYAPPTFLRPVLVWMTCQCRDTGEGAHILGCWVESLNCNHALMRVGVAISEAHSGKQPWFLIGEFPSIFSAMEVHLRMALDMQNGVGEERWEEGYEPYCRIYDAYREAPSYEAE